MSDDPWENLPVVYKGTIPRWMLDNARVECDEPHMTVDELVSMWIENMEQNAYDIARDEGTLPVPRLLGDPE